MLHIRPATAHDADLIAQLVRELAEYEQLLHEARAEPRDFASELAADQPIIRVLIAEWSGEPVGFALYFFNFSTFVGRPGLYLEDLFVRPSMRGKGIGLQLLAELARVAEARGCGRMEWAVLTWNTPAIRFYESLGARPLDEWKVYRLTPAEIASLSARARQTLS
jgi:GNAT superfamily N-acetyltransferase